MSEHPPGPTQTMKLTASAVPHSSVVGSSIKICDETGKIVAILAILVPNRELDYKTVVAAVSEEILWKFSKRPIAFRVKSKDGPDDWTFYEDEEAAYRFAESNDLEMQGLFVRDGT